MAFAEVTYSSRANIGNLPKEFKKFFYKGISDAMLYAENKSKESIGTSGKPGVISGHLRRSIQGRSNKEKGTLSSDVIYSAVHEYGAIITPKKAKALRFKIGDRWVTTQKVVIPKRPFLRPAFEDNMKDIEAIIKNRVTEGMS